MFNIYERLCAGENLDDIAKQIETELNDAKTKFDAQQKADLKRKEFDAALDGLVNWIDKWYPHLDAKGKDFAVVYDEIWEMFKLLDVIPAEGSITKDADSIFNAFFKANNLV